MTRHVFTPAERDIVRARYPHEDTKDLAAELGVSTTQLQGFAWRNGIKKTHAALSATWYRYCLQNGEPGRFRPGLVPHNKGQPMRVVGRMAETQFKNGRMPSTRVPVGTKRWRKGQWWQKVSELRAPARKDWRPLSHLLWEAHHGPIPAGKIIVFTNRNPHDLRPDNLEAITRAELVRRNSWHRWPKDIQDLMRAKAKLRRAIQHREQQQPQETRA
jgi:hypothetical protein